MIIDKVNALHYLWGNNCDSWVLNDTPELSIKLESMPPGTKEMLHYHEKAQQFFFILKGTASFYSDDKKHILAPQQGITVLPDQKHFIANETDGVLEFLVISQPSTHNDRIIL
jgi:mannose-6-phosphate isomerase-like protein (cupin superfamily)